MKKLTVIFLMLVISLSCSNVFAQGAPKPIFGAKGGVNFANIGGDETDNKMKTAFHAGVYSEVFFDYFLMMQMELLLSYQGHAGFDSAIPYSSSLNLMYINLPIMARYNIGYNLNVHAGIQLGFLLSAKRKEADFNGGELITNVKDTKKGLDFGIPIGVGYDLMDRKISASIRYIIPLSNLNNDPLSPSFRQTNSVFQVSLGIKLMTLDE